MDPAIRQAVRRRWAPRHLPRPPRVFIDPNRGVFAGATAGSNLSRQVNFGSEGGAFSIGATPTLGLLNGRKGILFDASGEKLSLTLGAWTSGVLSVFAVVVPNNRGAAFTGLFHMGAVQASGSIYCSPIGDNSLLVFSGNGYNHGAAYPEMEGTPTAPAYAIGSANIVGLQLAAAGNGAWTNGYDVLSQITAHMQAAAIPSYTSQAWDFGEGWAGGSEVFLGTVYALLLFDYVLKPSEWRRLEGWAAGEFGLRSLLAASHPYRNAAPTLPVG